MTQEPKLTELEKGKIAELTERVVIEYANHSGREEKNRGFFRESVEKILAQEIAKIASSREIKAQQETLQEVLEEVERLRHTRENCCCEGMGCSHNVALELLQYQLSKLKEV